MLPLKVVFAIALIASIVLGIRLFRDIYVTGPHFARLVSFGALLVYTIWLFAISTSVWRSIAVYAVMQVTLRLVTPILNRAELLIVQGARDRHAKKLFTGTVNETFVLYLRPFAITDRMSLLGASAKWTGVDVETLIAGASRNRGALVAFGRPGEAIGAGRIPMSEEAWQSAFCKLALRALAIILVPASSKGTAFEMEWLAHSQLMAKVIFLMPPRTTLTMRDRWRMPMASNTGEAYQNYSGRWMEAKEEAEALGLQLPEYRHEGAVLRLSASGQCIVDITLGPTPRDLLVAIRSQLAAISQFDTPVALK